MTVSGICISDPFVWDASMNIVIVSSPLASGGDDERRRVEAAGPVDAQNAPTRSLENAQNAFPTPPTRIDVLKSLSNKCYLCRRTDLLPRSPAGQIATTPMTNSPVNPIRRRSA